MHLLFTAMMFGSMPALGACGGWGGGNAWVQQPLVEEEERRPTSGGGLEGPSGPAQRASKTLGAGQRQPDEGLLGGDAPPSAGNARTAGGHVLGVFRNTYYDFPREADFSGPETPIMNASCAPIAKVPKAFFEAVCVQGGGSLRNGGTVSFAKRDCACAEICPRTGQRICFDALDAASFPWGRGATGRPIAPLRSVAADTSVLPMGTVLYIPELEGAPRGPDSEPADGCFVVEDRGLKVRGEHVDIFAGFPSQTAALNARVPSNKGVTIVVDSPRCAHLSKR
ncbi:hypothetical protein AKJ09_11200 [Labilithrix luteola]|uniref:3D domain-containing protein n=1 Tax=Labilithrix luteola TaxID=1391654 RepID=A0A0K1QFV0_9BACT|nr:hypothetical protein AKJ09_11200 [Labilithrix luteola]